ncbi:MAG: glycosyltransferase family 4 protein [Burkholderiaceae bacterium]
MRIAFYAPLKSPAHPTPSGDRRVARLYMDALSLAGHQVELVSELRSYERAGDALVQAAMRDRARHKVQSLLADWANGSASAVPELWFSYHVYYKAPDWLGPAVSAALRVPYVVAEASHAGKRAGGAWASGHDAATHAIRCAALLLSPTRDDILGLRQVAGDAANIVHMPPFLDASLYQNAAALRASHRQRLAARWDLNAGCPWIIVAAMMREGDKLASYGALAQALAQLIDLPWQLLVAGDGAASDAVHTLLHTAAPGRVRFAGECAAPELAAIYAAGDLFVWPAVNEAYGMAMLEAQAAGLPVVSSATRGVQDVVKHAVTGLLAPPGDVPGFTHHIRALLQDDVRRRAMGVAAARFVATERSTAQAAESLRRHLANLAPVAAPTGERAP